MKNRTPFVNHLDELGITVEEFQLYWNTFVKHGTRYWIKNDYESTWYQLKTRYNQPRPLTKYIVVKHLQGEFWVSKQMSGKTDFFSIDLDNKNRASLRARYEKIIEVFPKPLALQSSASGGLHLYYFLDREHYKANLKAAVTKTLHKNEIYLISGEIELFHGNTAQLRLPFGKDSTIVDSKSLQTIGYTLKDSLAIVKEHPKTIIHHIKPVYNNFNKKIKYNVSDLEIDKILKNGIIEYGTRYQLQSKLVWYFMMIQKLSADETEKIILGWYNSKNHKSKDWENRPEKVKIELKSVIKNLERKIQYKYSFINESLSLEDVKFILEFTSVDSEQFDHFSLKLQKFIFNLFQFYKPSKTQTKPLAFNLLVDFAGASKHTVYRLKLFCIRNGLLIMAREYDRINRKCSIYELDYSFREGTMINTFEKALHILYNKSELFKMYKRGTYEKIMSYHSLSKVG